MRFSILVFFCFLLLACEVPQSVREKQATETVYDFSRPQKISCKQIQSGDDLLGYMDEYQWYNKEGVLRQHFFVYDPHWQQVAYIRDDGKTLLYTKGTETQDLGKLPLESSLERVFQVSQVYVDPIQKENILLSEREQLKVVIAETGSLKNKQASKEIEKLEKELDYYSEELEESPQGAEEDTVWEDYYGD